MKHAAAVVASLLLLSCASSREEPGNGLRITHGPMLGRPGPRQMGVWVRTSRPGTFTVRCRRFVNNVGPGVPEQISVSGTTGLEHDNTGWVVLPGLQPDTEYAYVVEAGGRQGPGGVFRTLPESKPEPRHNPKGLFNFSFEFACGNNQNKNSHGPALPAFRTMIPRLRGKIDFAILNGDWLYEYKRETTVDRWRAANGVPGSAIPRGVRLDPPLVGVWANYKGFLERAEPLRYWHRMIPSFYTADDHEILNDVVGCGSPGFRDRRAVFRDPAIRAWYDYLAWSNPVVSNQGIVFGRAALKAGSDVLTDPEADFTKVDLAKATTLHVHWGTPDAGVDDIGLDGKGGDPNAGVYAIEEVLDAHRLKIRPAAKADGRQTYSIGRQNWGRLRVSNCEILFLDTRSYREYKTPADPKRKTLSMLGNPQKAWLKETMTGSDADFFFVVSSVNFMIPHVGSGGMAFAAADKDDAWTKFPEEREELVKFFDSLGRPVMVLTGDLHNSWVVKVTDRVWEFAAGPHNSGNHPAKSEGGRPASGPFDSRGRKVDIRWSTYFGDDTPVLARRLPVYAVAQVNNVFTNPTPGGAGTRTVAFPRPQVVIRYYNGLTGELMYAEAVTAAR